VFQFLISYSLFLILFFLGGFSDLCIRAQGDDGLGGERHSYEERRSCVHGTNYGHGQVRAYVMYVRGAYVYVMWCTFCRLVELKINVD
jgi:hypothetical protein